MRSLNGQAKRVCVLSWPSHLALNSIRHLWTNKHIVFPILPTRSHRLVHLLAESRCDTLLTDPAMPETDFVHIKDNLGVPVIRMSDRIPPINKTSGPLLYESRTQTSTIPLVGEMNSLNWENMKLPFPGSILPYSTNWVFDAAFSEDVVFARSNGSLVTPQTIILDFSTIDSLLTRCERSWIDTSKTESIVVDICSRNSDVGKMNMKQLKEKVKGLSSSARIFSRVFVPELGGLVADLSPLDKNDYIVVPGFELDRSDSDDLLVKPASLPDITYVGRPKSSADVFGEDGRMKIVTYLTESWESEVLVPRRERLKKKRVMQPDWRIRQVPIAVYHKKRGFKGQIYYTTKHKGWTFYRSRYYN